VNWEAAIAQYQQQMEETLGQQNLASMFQSKLIEAGLGPDSDLVAEALGAPFAAAGTESATAFAQSLADFDWGSNVGEPAGSGFASAFLGAAGAALAKPGAASAFRDSMQSFVINVVQEYFFGGAQP
jgi:hypothetical protein